MKIKKNFPAWKLFPNFYCIFMWQVLKICQKFEGFYLGPLIKHKHLKTDHTGKTRTKLQEGPNCIIMQTNFGSYFFEFENRARLVSSKIVHTKRGPVVVVFEATSMTVTLFLVARCRCLLIIVFFDSEHWDNWQGREKHFSRDDTLAEMPKLILLLLL